MNEGRNPEYPEKTPADKFQNMPHTKAQNFKLHPTLEPFSSIGGRRLLGKQTYKPPHHASPPDRDDDK